MLISESKKFLLVHIQKTGGTSLRSTLKDNVPDLKLFLGTHDHAAQGQQVLGDAWSDYYKVAFVRNPWDRLVSWYMMIVQKGHKKSWSDRILGKQVSYNNRLWEYVLTHSNSFEEFIQHCTNTIEDTDGKKNMFYNQLDYLTDEQGRLLVDFVGRFENLTDDAATIFKKIGLDDVNLCHVNRSSHRHWSTYYTDQTRQIVAQRYARDIAYFGYEFEPAKQPLA